MKHNVNETCKALFWKSTVWTTFWTLQFKIGDIKLRKKAGAVVSPAGYMCCHVLKLQPVYFLSDPEPDRLRCATLRFLARETALDMPLKGGMWRQRVNIGLISFKPSIPFVSFSVLSNICHSDTVYCLGLHEPGASHFGKRRTNALRIFDFVFRCDIYNLFDATGHPKFSCFETFRDACRNS